MIIIVGHNVNKSRTTKPISARIKYPLWKKIDELAGDKFKDKSNFIENAVLFYLDSLEDIKMSDQLEHLLNYKKDYKNIKEELSVIDIENQRVSTDIMRKTYAKYVDKALAHIYLSNKMYELTEDELEHMLKSHLEQHRPRARYYGCEGLIDVRKEDPIQYAQDMVDHMKKENSLSSEMQNLASKMSG